MFRKQVLEALASSPITGCRVYESTGSTNDIALDWASGSAPDSALVIADQQTSGRGRLKRKWHTNPGSSLAFSIIIRPKVGEIENHVRFSILAVIAVTDSLLKHYHLQAEIKWPNDVLINRKKVCGILSETSWYGDQIQAIVIGIGINVASSSVPPVDFQLFPATSIEDELGKPVDRMEVLAMVVNSFFEWRKSVSKPDIFNYWQEHLAYRGEPVRIIEDGKTIASGRLSGITQTGELELTTGNDAKITVMTGDVHLRPGG